MLCLWTPVDRRKRKGREEGEAEVRRRGRARNEHSNFTLRGSAALCFYSERVIQRAGVQDRGKRHSSIREVVPMLGWRFLVPGKIGVVHCSAGCSRWVQFTLKSRRQYKSGFLSDTHV